MSWEPVIANVDRAGDHAAALLMLVVIAVVGGVIYGLVRLVAKSRASRTRSHLPSETDRGPEA